MATRRGLVPRLVESAASRLNSLDETTGMVGHRIVDAYQYELLEAGFRQLGYLQRDMEHMGWSILNYDWGEPQEVKFEARREMAQKSRYVWLRDPQAGRAVNLMNEFVFGRGVPRPRAKDPKVQEVIDAAWDDPNNQRILTSNTAMNKKGTDLSLQSNVFFLIFEGDDGKVKLGLLNHDEVENVVRDPENRLRILYYVARHKKQRWDFEKDAPAIDMKGQMEQAKTVYYEAWGALEEAENEREQAAKAGIEMEPIPEPPEQKLGYGFVYHIAINLSSEMAFGVPEMERTIRWFTAYNDFMKARVDIMQAVAAFSMKRKVKGSENQLYKQAARVVSRQSPLATAHQEAAAATGLVAGPRPGSVLNENEGVTHEPFKLDSGAGNAAVDARMLGAQVSAGHGWPRPYFGDSEAGSLATATSLELPVLKTVEARQEVFEAMLRFFIDRVIENAVDAGLLDRELDEDELAALRAKKDAAQATAAVPAPPAAPEDAAGGVPTQPPMQIAAAHEDVNEDEEETLRDLSYDFSLPSPLRRMMNELVSSVAETARTFDPNNENVELSRYLLTILLGEAFEIADPAAAVEEIFPEGFMTSTMAAARASAVPNMFGPEAEGMQVPTGPDGNAYSAPMNARPAEKAYPQLQQAAMGPHELQEAMREGRVAVGRAGQLLVFPRRYPQAVGSLRDLPETEEIEVEHRAQDAVDRFDDEVGTPALEALTRATANGTG